MLFIFKNQIPPKKNSRQLLKKKNSLVSIPSQHYSDWHKFIRNNINNIVVYNNNENNNLSFYFNKTNLKIKAIFNPKNNKRFDLTNVLQSIEDTLTDLKIINDDDFKILSNFNYRIENLNSEIFLILEIEENNSLGNNNIEIIDYTKIVNTFLNKALIFNDFIWKSKSKKSGTHKINKNKPRVLYTPTI